MFPYNIVWIILSILSCMLLRFTTISTPLWPSDFVTTTLIFYQRLRDFLSKCQRVFKSVCKWYTETLVRGLVFLYLCIQVCFLTCDNKYRRNKHYRLMICVWFKVSYPLATSLRSMSRYFSLLVDYCTLLNLSGVTVIRITFFSYSFQLYDILR